MSKFPPNFNWRESPPHLDFLSKYIKPRDTQQTASWQYIKESLREDPGTAIERFIRDGALVPTSLEEIIGCLFIVAQLKKLLQERDIRTSGSKSELIDQLVSADRLGMEKLTQKSRIMKCSSTALDILSEFEKQKQHALDVAKQQSFGDLKNNNPKSAYKAYVIFQRKFVDPRFESDSFKAEELQYILTGQPKILADITPENLKLLRAATCMQTLWDEETPEIWLPSTFSSGLKKNRVAINYLAAHARLKGELDGCENITKRVRFSFYPGDIDSCELCQSFNGKVVAIDKVPELPMIGCKSETGCKCHIDSVLSDDEERGSLKFDIGIDEIEIDPVSKLRQLKQMLDEGLISHDEYEKKKGEILSRL